MTTKARLIDRALFYCSEAPLAPGETGKRADVMNAAYDDDAIKHILEQGFWNCAVRTLQMEYDPSIAPTYGYGRAFRVPDDWVRTYAISPDEFKFQPLQRFEAEARVIYCDWDVIYLSYISDDAAFGGNLANWPPSLADAGARYLAQLAMHAFNASESKIEAAEKRTERAFKIARGLDAMNGPTLRRPPGQWVSARRGSGAVYNDFRAR